MRARRTARAWVALFFASCAGIAPASGFAEESDPLVWRPEWRRFEAGDWIFTGVLAGTLGAVTVAFNSPKTTFTGGILFDDAVRDALRIGNSGRRLAAANVSDVFQATMVVYPLVIDSLLLTWIARDSREAGLEMFAISGEALILSTTLTTVTKDLTGRARPYTESCGSPTCGSTARNKSFFSGHAATAFAGAGLICAHHEALPLYESPNADAAVCAASLLMASATGILRIAADEHYATDVIAGAIVGLASGYLFPKLLYYRPFGFELGPMAEAGVVGVRVSFSN